MLSRTLLQQPLAGSIALIALAGSAAPAAAADITLTEAKIEAGFLVVAGTTATPNMRVRLDGQSEPAFNAVSARGGAFSFSIVYHPGDCIVTLQTVIPPFAALGAPTNGLVANCGPAGLSPRGAWSEAAPYVKNDLVTHLGSTWRARRNNVGNEPVEGGNWELFAAAGQPAGEVSEAGGGQADNTRAPPDGPAGGDLTGEYPDPQIRNQAVEAENIALGAVTTVRIANQAVTTPKIANDAVTTPKIAEGAVTGAQIADGAITSAKVLDDTVVGGGLAATDLAVNSVGSSEIATDGVAATEIANDSIDSGEIIDFSLSNQDVGVLFAQVNANGTIANSSGGVTSSRIFLGQYEVDFAVSISSCAFVASQGESGVGGAPGAIMGVTDRGGNAEAVFVTVRTNANAAADRAFQLVVVC